MSFAVNFELMSSAMLASSSPPPILLSDTYSRQPLKHLHTAMLKALKLHYLEAHFEALTIAEEQKCTIVNLKSAVV